MLDKKKKNQLQEEFNLFNLLYNIWLNYLLKT